LGQKYSHPNIVAVSRKMQEVLATVERVAPTNSTVLLGGESGVGKDLIARAIHEKSRRASGPFIKINSTAIPENLLESELFGYEKGAFTGAATSKPGKFELADKGTLFLDEIGDVPATTQVKLLRVLQEREFERLGGTRTVKVDVRLLAATNRDLRAALEDGTFREDLYYRLRVVTVELPALRQHREDIPALVEAFLAQFGARHNRKVKMSRAALDRVCAYEWPGNVRELRNAVERSVVLCRGDEITVNDLPEEIREGARPASGGGGDTESGFLGESDFREAKRQFEIVYLKRKLEEHRWNVSKTAAVVGLHRQSLQEKLRELGIQRPGK